jgi:hypothetical protein
MLWENSAAIPSEPSSHWFQGFRKNGGVMLTTRGVAFQGNIPVRGSIRCGNSVRAQRHI